MTNGISGNAMALAPLPKQSVVFVAIFTVVLPAMIVIAMLAFPDHGLSPTAAAVVAAVVVAIDGALLAVMRRRSMTLEDNALVLRATLYSRRIALKEIDLDAVRVLDLREHPEYRPRLKTNGLAVPGLAAGNFRDRRGNKIFCLVTAPQVVVLPLSTGNRVLLSPAHPERFLNTLRESAGRLAQN